MVRTHRFISAPRLRMQMIHRFGRGMSVWTIRRQLLATGYWSRCPTRCPRLTLEHRRRRREWGRRHRVWYLRQWRYCILSDESRFSLYDSDGWVRVHCWQGERLIDACVQPNDGNRGPSVMAWGAIHHGGRSELVVVDGAINGHWYIQILRNQTLSWATGVFGRNFVYIQDNAQPHTARDTQPFWTNRMLRSWTGQLVVQTWTHLSMFGIKRRGLQFSQEGCGPWSRACLAVSGLFWPQEAGTHATRGQKGNIMFHQYVVNCFNVPYWSLVLAPNVN